MQKKEHGGSGSESSEEAEEDTTSEDTTDSEESTNTNEDNTNTNQPTKKRKIQEIVYTTPPILPTNLYQLILLAKKCHEINQDPNQETHYRDCKGLDKAYAPLVGLYNLIGQKQIKEQVYQLVLRQLQSKELKTMELPHIVIFGGPGLGKSTIIHFLAHIFASIGTIRKKKLIFAHMPTSFVADVLGKTAHNTRKLFESARNGILVIDEMQNLADNRHAFSSDSYSKSAADVMCSLLTEQAMKVLVVGCGYEMELKRDFFTLNPGLESRFPLKLYMQPYSSEELRLIALKKIKDKGLHLMKECDLSLDYFQDLKLFPAFGRSATTFVDIILSIHSIAVFGQAEKKAITKDSIEKGFKEFTQSK
jgi:stage V sporulation protein K